MSYWWSTGLDLLSAGCGSSATTPDDGEVYAANDIGGFFATLCCSAEIPYTYQLK